MAVRRGIITDATPVAASRQPSLRAARPAAEGALFELFGGTDGQPFSISFDAAVRVQRPFTLLADLRQSTGRRVILLTDAGAWISGAINVQADHRLRIGQRMSHLADLSQKIGVGVAISVDAAFTIYRVILHEDHLILT